MSSILLLPVSAVIVRCSVPRFPRAQARLRIRVLVVLLVHLELLRSVLAAFKGLSTRALVFSWPVRRILRLVLFTSLPRRLVGLRIFTRAMVVTRLTILVVLLGSVLLLTDVPAVRLSRVIVP